MIKLFANHGTTEKALVMCSDRESVVDAIILLNKQRDSNWIPIDELNPEYEILKFDDGIVYKGFHNRNERYVKGIVTVETDGEVER